MRDLLDASVWIPLSAPEHVHYLRARRYWDEESRDDLAFCRVTALALLRHLTNAKILRRCIFGWRLRHGKALETWLAVPRITLLAEPPGIDEILAKWAGKLNLRSGHWTDAYLAAFALASGCRLVAFDDDFHRYPGIEFLHLKA